MTGLVIFIIAVASAVFVQWAKRRGGINDSGFSGGSDSTDSNWHHHDGGHSDGGGHGGGDGGSDGGGGSH